MGREAWTRLILDFERFAIARWAAHDVLAAYLRAAADPAVSVEGRAAVLRSDQ
ncbi:hypothetical protein HEP81_08217 (plasmid) [Streptomyces griseofuscus]|uniref:Uncharacterized protein n=1 Tax=Streptomyces griseofuscus TaxID=146922 RepID=A0A7H1QDR3_9ACTN|nr:hypothetical protein [Streptomyces griseofuscus]QNT98443.1 hypothetical protein HEP81_08217 [Streptomyces griseofuscus]